jgi:signal peptidase I
MERQVTEGTTDNSHARKAEGGVLEHLWLFGLALFVGAVVVPTFLFQPFNIPSGSLVPTLLEGDYLLVSKYSYGYSRYSLPFGLPLFEGRIMASEPKRGDIVVFKLPKDGKTDYIKRVIGLPGDRVQLVDARLYINGTEVPREPLAPYHTDDAYGRPVDVPHYRETLPEGASHEIIQMDGDTGFWSNTRVYTVPQGHFFMMGDNRDNSQDSRVLSEVGYVPFENLRGRAEIIFFSMDEDASFWRVWEWPRAVHWSRIFQKIK